LVFFLYSAGVKKGASVSTKIRSKGTVLIDSFANSKAAFLCVTTPAKEI
jgi:hypothetical protein